MNELNDLLSNLGFIKGTGFDGEVWTNIDSEYLTQVWICITGDPTKGSLSYDATKGFNLAHFFKWWEKVSASEQPCQCCGR